MARTLFAAALYALRNLQSRRLFAELEQVCQGEVIDVGGWDFFDDVCRHPRIGFTRWLTVEPTAVSGRKADPRHEFLQADGCHLPLADSSFDTALNIQVLEHVLEPLQMMKEMARVLKPGGHAVVMVPQTGALHFVPDHYQNVTRYWLLAACKREGLDVVRLLPLGGRWQSTASHFFYFFLAALRVRHFSGPEYRRSAWFYLLFPFMALFALASIPICLLFSLGDLTEEANNWLLVARKPPVS